MTIRSRSTALRWTGMCVAAALCFAACSDEGGSSETSPPTVSAAPSPPSSAPPTTDSPTTSTTTTTTPPVAPGEVSGPVTGGNGTIQPQPATPLPDGYVEEEFFIGGTAGSYRELAPPAADGTWAVEAADTADYLTRVIVRRPPADRFSGTVLVEWLNVTAVEASPDWGYLVEEIGVSGHAYVAVSAQALGVIGGESLLSVEIDETAVADAGVDTAEVDTGGLVNADPARYGRLDHPGDAFAYDIYAQVGAALAANEGGILAGLEATQVIAMGESQSAGFLTTYVDAVHPIAPVYDAFLVHSRGAGGAPLDGVFADDSSFVDRGLPIRPDLDVPVFVVEAETDLTMLGYTLARQDDTDRVRTWEIAGTAHADAHVIRSILGGARDASVGSLLGCVDPINTGPHHEVVSAALRHLVVWAAGGDAPPTGERIRVTDADPVEIVRDEIGYALGGVRNPLVDVPVVVTTGDPWVELTLDDAEDFDICALFGRTIPIERSGLLELHGSADGYVEAFEAAVADAVAAGFLLDHDAAQLREEAEGNRGLFG